MQVYYPFSYFSLIFPTSANKTLKTPYFWWKMIFKRKEGDDFQENIHPWKIGPYFNFEGD